MKKIFVILLVLIMMTGVIGCTRDNRASNQNEAPAFSFDIPEEWEGMYERVDSDNWATFNYTGYKINNEFYQSFFSIVVMTEEEYDLELEEELFLGTKLGEKDGYVYVLFTPLDNIISDEDKIEEFNNLFLSDSEIQSRFNID